MAHGNTRVVRKFGIVYVLLAVGLAYFAILPTIYQGGQGFLYLVTVFWMLVLAGIMTTYILAVVCFGGEDGHD